MDNEGGSIRDGFTRGLYRARYGLLLAGLIGAGGYALYRHPPLQTIERGEVGVRSNALLGKVAEFHEGSVLVLPGLHQLRRLPLRDQIYRPEAAEGQLPYQSLEGLSLGIDLAIRYALDPDQVVAIAGRLPDDIAGEVVAPAVQGVIYKVLTRYTVKEIFSTKRGEIQQEIEGQLKPALAGDGLLLRGVQIGRVELPADYRAGMERLLAEELESEKMRYTLELKDKQVKQSELEAEADKVRREKAAEAAASEQVIAAKAQEEAMKHVLPFKQKQVEQRQLEAEAEKVARIRGAEGAAEARRIEAQGEADSRVKLAEAEAYRQDRLGKIASAQLERDGALLTRNPLLIQKTMADKLSDKVQVIIAPTPASGGFIGSALLGQGKDTTQTAARSALPADSNEEGAQ
jgi:regulator of protease activity HflC (stomatin/prohibitin superfamily)